MIASSVAVVVALALGSAGSGGGDAGGMGQSYGGSTSSSSSSSSSSSPTKFDAAVKKEPSGMGQVGVGLLAGGAALAAATAATATLVQAVTTPDDNRDKPQHPELTEVFGFVTVAVGSLAAGLAIVGGALVLEDAVGPAPAAPSPTG